MPDFVDVSDLTRFAADLVAAPAKVEAALPAIEDHNAERWADRSRDDRCGGSRAPQAA